MGTSGAAAVVGVCLLALVAMASIGSVHATLTTNFYDKSCPKIYSIVQTEIKKAVKAEKRKAASLVRLHFHDCFVQGCDGSLLLDNAPGIVSEKFSLANNNSVRGFEVIDTIKAALEKSCPRTVSCADILAIASRDAAVEVGLTPSYPVFFGRRDGTTANRDLADKNLPAPQSNYSELKKNFAKVGLDETDLVALSGAHTIGRVRCQIVRLFGVNIPNTNAEFRANLSKACPNESVDFTVFQNLDLKTPDKFDNNYYKNLRRGEGIIPSDQTLQSTPGPNQAMVKDFAQNQENFFKQFPLSTIKMGNIGVITDRKKGQIRVNCRVVNPPKLIEQVLIASE